MPDTLPNFRGKKIKDEKVGFFRLLNESLQKSKREISFRHIEKVCYIPYLDSAEHLAEFSRGKKLKMRKLAFLGF